MKRGVTYIELLIVVTIVSILALSAIPVAKYSVKRQKEIELRRALRTIRTAIDEYKKLCDKKVIECDPKNYGYPPDLETLVKGVKDKNGKLHKFLRRIPKDPITDSFDWGLRAYEDDPDSDSWGGENVYDVYTKSNEKAIDGTYYKDW